MSYPDPGVSLLLAIELLIFSAIWAGMIAAAIVYAMGGA